ncbi:MAG: hypothetical protein PHE51_12470 [Eubacteriales bacterium]|nr:hypothetical protein [Eubacteriales bacterium]
MGFLTFGDYMQEKAMYFAKKELYQKIIDAGGMWNDSKERPVVCLIESTEIEGLFWAIPVGAWNHRDKDAQDRINRFIQLPSNNLGSCYYHVGNTTVKSIFFISDVIPIIEKYIDREYEGFNKQLYIIKNRKLLQEITYKLTRILAMESSNNNYFRQKITNIKNILVSELELSQAIKEVASTKEEQ